MSEPWVARLIGRILLRATALEDLDDDHTAHIGYVTEELYRTFYRAAAASIAWLDTSAK
jgi:hypothetical protein